MLVRKTTPPPKKIRNSHCREERGLCGELPGVREGQEVRPCKGGWLWVSTMTAGWRQKRGGGRGGGVRSEGGYVLQAAKRGGKPGRGLEAQDLMSVLEQEQVCGCVSEGKGRPFALHAGHFSSPCHSQVQVGSTTIPRVDVTAYCT